MDYVGFHLVFLFVFAPLAGICKAKGRSTVRIDQPTATTPLYPSLARRRYYIYYKSYFTPAGLFYAKFGHDNPRTHTTCENYEPYFDNDTLLGVFPCPMAEDPDDFTHCCGQSRYEYCCRLVDTTNFQLSVGLGVAGALGLIIAVIVCVVFSLKSSQKRAKAKKNNKRQLLQAGIPKYTNKSTGRYSSMQSEDGYMIIVRFKKASFYDDFLSHLRNKYAALAWRYRDNGTRKEVKVTFDDGSWVTIVLQDMVQGKPQMTVVREKAAVEWMDTVFENICQQIPDDTGLCSCLASKQKQVHPEATTSSKANSGQLHNSKYEMHKSRSSLGNSKDQQKY